ncbi:hypothetical protein [Winogradskya humida]|uniref:Preprotein translocase subunit SecB n=1 Tax=Winogradskya humida TaxID=113566 RepID=A0ABQ3ZMF2_9ACTN|nr:hypothetical protein [Actinoplanes humidus]GIE19759.1 hypothetical protein Ahu01nite_028610 [Actinoplanes humidus]
MSGRTVNDLKTLQSLLELTTVRIYELAAKRKDGFGLEDLAADSDHSNLEVSIDFETDSLTFRCRIEMNGRGALFAVDVAAIFALSEEIEEPPAGLMDEFSRNAGLPIVTSYIRVHIQQLARQLGVAIPVLKHYWPHEYDEVAATHPAEVTAVEA